MFKVTDTGLVYLRNGDEYVQAKITANGPKCRYRKISVKQNGMWKRISVHRLIAEAFVPNPNNYPQVNHIDGNSFNNMASNLEWCTQSQNMRHAYAIGLVDRGKKEKEFERANAYERKGAQMYLTIKQAAQLLNVSTKTIQRRIKDGSIKAYRLSERAIRIAPLDLQTWLDSRKGEL